MRSVRRTFSIWKTIHGAWKEAFPDEIDIQTKLQKRKEEAQKQRIFAEKILEGTAVHDEHIAEWKRGAIVKAGELIHEDVDEEDEEGLIEKLKLSVFKIRDDDGEFQAFQQELNDVSSYKSELQDNLGNRISYSDNLVLNKAKEVVDKVRTRFSSDVYMEMRKRDPDFDMDVFEEELKYTFVDMYNSYLRHDIDHIQKVSGSDAYATFSGLIQSQTKSNTIHKYKEILNVIDFAIGSAILTESKNPLFVCNIRFYEIECLIDKTEPEKVVEGNLNWPTYRDFGFYVIPHPKPDIEKVGHEWVIIRVEDRTKNLRLENKAEDQQNAGDKDDAKKEK